MKKCPYCAEKVKEEAIKCKHCNATLGQNEVGILRCKNCNGEMKKKTISGGWKGLFLIGIGLIFWFLELRIFAVIIIVIGIIIGVKIKYYWACRECGSLIERQRKWFELK